MTPDQNYITEVRTAVKMAFQGIIRLKAAQTQWNSGDYYNTLENGTGDNEGIPKAAVGACVFDTANALMAVLEAGHGTNLEKLL